MPLVAAPLCELDQVACLWNGLAMEAAHSESGFSKAKLALTIMGALTLSALMVGLGSLWLGDEIANTTHTDAKRHVEIIIGGETLFIPVNEIRFKPQRRPGRRDRADLYFLWPSGLGFSKTLEQQFNAGGSDSNLIFIVVTKRQGDPDMSGRLDLVYKPFFEGVPHAGPAGLSVQRLRKGAGFDGEALFFQPNRTMPFVARCPIHDALPDLKYCLRDIHAGQNLHVSYRFPIHLIAEWKSIEELVRNKVADWRR
ncbi:MAG: hypothetical protein AAF468_04705 [Pseudomonadota bacterium]